MLFKLTSLAALISAVSAQSLTEALSSNNQTSQLAALVGTLPDVQSSLGSAQNITLLAPSNNALSAFLNSTVGAALGSNTDAVAAL
jgi:hypothetical protein